MISDIFYSKGIDQSKDEYLYDENYLFYYINKMLLQNGPSEIDEIKEWIKERNGASNIKAKNFDSFLSHFVEVKNTYHAKDETVSIFKKIVKFNSVFFNLSWKPREDLFKNLSSFIGQTQFNFADSLPYILALYKINQGLTQEYYTSLFFTNLIKYDDNYRKLDYCINQIDEGYKKLTIDYIFSDKIIIDILFANGIITMGELVELSVDSLLLIFSSNIDFFLSILSKLQSDFMMTYKNTIMSVFGKLSEKEKEIISLRNGFNSHKPMTLEEIGEAYGVSRERIRQIEAKGMKKIFSNLHLANTIFASIYFNLIGKNDKYITREKLIAFVNDDSIVEFIMLLMSENESFITYDLKLEIIYNRKEVSLEYIEEEIMDVYGDYLSINDFEALDDFEKKVIESNYRIVNNNVYLRKGVLERKLVTTIIDDLFQDGYHISDETSFKKIQEEYLKRYGYWDEGLSMRLISTYTERENYCQIARGTYKNRKYVINLNSYLKDRIINYILENQPIVYYVSIYEHFKKEIEKLGVDNYFYLKGLIDLELPTEFTTKRNYIRVGETKISSSENIVYFFRSFNTIFTFKELKMRFEGVKDYTLYNYLYSEIDNGLIWLSSKRFIYIDKSNISENAKYKLEEYLSLLFGSLNTKVISSRKVFSRMMLTNKPLLDDLKIVDDQFSMFSLIKYLFSEKYYFRRPLIAIDKDSSCDQDSVVREYASKLDKFNLKMIKAYQAKLSLKGLYSYLEFMEDMSDEYTQINIDTMVKKDLLGITESFKKEFGEMFSLIFSKFNTLDTRTFNGYMLLPRLEFKWNKYLLVGIIRTYFDDIYEIENTNSFYNLTDFIIKKIK